MRRSPVQAARTIAGRCRDIWSRRLGSAAIVKVAKLLRPGGHFISSTACLGGNMKIFKLIAPVGHFFGLLPVLLVFTTNKLVTSLKKAGFEIETQWSPGKKGRLHRRP